MFSHSTDIKMFKNDTRVSLLYMVYSINRCVIVYSGDDPTLACRVWPLRGWGCLGHEQTACSLGPDGPVAVLV